MVISTFGPSATTQIGTDSFRRLDITGVTLPITKHNYFVGSVEQLADTIREAFVLAKSGRSARQGNFLCGWHDHGRSHGHHH